VVLQKLNPGGIFVTQSGPAGIMSCTEVFTCINATIKSVFPTVVPYSQHIPSFCDIWGYNLAFSDPDMKKLTAGEQQESRRALAACSASGRLDAGLVCTSQRSAAQHSLCPVLCSRDSPGQDVRYTR
jgi:predicted membrane-bound spermidine synthase